MLPEARRTPQTSSKRFQRKNRSSAIGDLWHDKGGNRQIHFVGNRSTMDITATELRIGQNDANDYLARTWDSGSLQCKTVKNLDVETVASNPLLPTDRKWAIRFNAGGTATIVLGMKDYGRGWLSAYFADLVTARLGIPFQKVRVYYSATLPAVLQTPGASPTVLRRNQIGSVANAVADVIEGLCDQAIERGRSAFAAMAGIDAVDVGFDQAMGRFFFMNKDCGRNILEIAEASRSAS